MINRIDRRRFAVAQRVISAMSEYSDILKMACTETYDQLDQLPTK